MPVANNSYIASTTELFYYEEERYIRQLLTDTDAEDPMGGSFLTSGKLDRLYSALNYGRQQIAAILRNRYPVDTWTSATAPDLVKSWNARYAIARLELRRLYPSAEPREIKALIDAEILEFSYADADKILPGGRSEQVLPETGAVLSGDFMVDDTDQFGNLRRANDDYL